MADLTTDPNDPRLGHGTDSGPAPQNQAYLILSEEERAKGFVRPVRRTYKHVGERPRYPLRELTEEEHERFDRYKYVRYEAYPQDPSGSGVSGRYWTEEQLRPGCGGVTTMAQEFAETYARTPSFYGSTYCCTCNMHRPVREFIWIDDETQVGS